MNYVFGVGMVRFAQVSHWVLKLLFSIWLLQIPSKIYQIAYFISQRVRKYKQEKKKTKPAPFAFMGVVNKMKNEDFWDYWRFFSAALSATLSFLVLCGSVIYKNIQISALISLC